MKPISEMNIKEIYSELLLNKKYNLKEYLKEFNINDLYNRARELYKYENGIEDISNEELEKWLHDKCSYDVLSDLLWVMLIKLKDYEDKFMFYNFPVMIDLMYDFLESCKIDNQYNVKDFTKLTDEQIDKYICEILKKIDPTYDWLGIYETAKNDGKVLYLNNFNKEQLEELRTKLSLEEILVGNNCIALNDGNCYLALTYNNTVQDIINTIHELIHYIVKTNKVETPPILSEFFSIFYELYTIYYLKEQGFSINELFTIYQKIRIADLALISLTFKPLYHYFTLLAKNRKISINDDLKHYEELLESLKKVGKIPNKYKNMQPIDLAYKKCDEYIKFLLDEEFYKMYPYIIGSYLTFEAFQKFNDKMLNNIRSFISTSGTIDPYDVFEIIGCDVENLELVRVGEETKGIQKEKRP